MKGAMNPPIYNGNIYTELYDPLYDYAMTRIGERNRSATGIDMEIIGYDQDCYNKRFVIRFDDGIEVFNEYSAFKKGKVPHPLITQNRFSEYCGYTNGKIKVRTSDKVLYEALSPEGEVKLISPQTMLKEYINSGHKIEAQKYDKILLDPKTGKTDWIKIE